MSLFRAKFGSVEEDICKLKPFRCLRCGEDVKNEKEIISRHLRSHSLSHSQYVREYVKNNNFNGIKKETESDPEEEESLKNQSMESSHPQPVSKHPMNVTDRSVKSCSACSLDFPSRLRFIRHCHLVHKMKFKLRNGDKLVLP